LRPIRPRWQQATLAITEALALQLALALTLAGFVLPVPKFDRIISIFYLDGLLEGPLPHATEAAIGQSAILPQDLCKPLRSD
jgi:hypothetical protein